MVRSTYIINKGVVLTQKDKQTIAEARKLLKNHFKRKIDHVIVWPDNKKRGALHAIKISFTDAKKAVNPPKKIKNREQDHVALTALFSP